MKNHLIAPTVAALLVSGFIALAQLPSFTFEHAVGLFVAASFGLLLAREYRRRPRCSSSLPVAIEPAPARTDRPIASTRSNYTDVLTLLGGTDAAPTIVPL